MAEVSGAKGRGCVVGQGEGGGGQRGRGEEGRTGRSSGDSHTRRCSLGWNKMGPTGASAVAHALKSNATLQSLKFEEREREKKRVVASDSPHPLPLPSPSHSA